MKKTFTLIALLCLAPLAGFADGNNTSDVQVISSGNNTSRGTTPSTGGCSEEGEDLSIPPYKSKVREFFEKMGQGQTAQANEVIEKIRLLRKSSQKRNPQKGNTSSASQSFRGKAKY